MTVTTPREPRAVASPVSGSASSVSGSPAIPGRLPSERLESATAARTVLLAAVGLLACLGVLAVQSSSATTRSPGFEPIYLTRHLINLALGVALAAGVARVPPVQWCRFAWWIYGGAVLLLLLVAVPGVGLSAGGACRWLRLPGFTLQPSEWAKLAVPLLAARVLSGRAHVLDQLVLLVSAAGVFALVLRQPDLGTTMLLAGGLGIALVLGDWPLRRLLALGFAGVAVVAIGTLRGYQLRRIEGLWATWQDWREAPYQLRQSLVCFGEGGWTGVGLGRGWQKLSFLPEGHTDFVVAVIGEELGVVGVAFVAACWLAVLAAGTRLIMLQPLGSFRFILGATLLLQLVTQAALNGAVVTALVPPTGIPHPLLSYGGNSLLVTMVSLGLLLSCTQVPRDAVLPREVPQ